MFMSADSLTAPTITDSSTTPLKSLLVGVISQAVADRALARWQADVEAFFSGPAFARYCGLLGWNEQWVRRHII
jgi:hypothetical protein